MNELLSRSYEKVVGKGLYPLYETYLRGRNTFKYWAEFEETQWLSPEELKALQWTRLQAILHHAYDTVPFYRSAWSDLGIHPDDIRTPQDFSRLPTIDKPTIRQNYDAFFSSAYDKRSLVKRATGGSTGAPLQFCYDRNSYQRRLAAWFRGDRWAGWELCGGDFYIWGSSILPQAPLEKWKATLHHAGMRRVIINSFELSRDKIAPLVRRYNRMAPRVVCGYTNAIYEFARQVKQAGLSLHAPSGVITSAEKLYAYQREVIEEAFGAKVFDRYGCREVMMIGAECDQHTGLHVTADNLYVEIARGGVPCEPGQVGEVVITDLHNYGFPLIRYRIGDAASWRGEPCSCGRGLPLINVIEGRCLDLISTPAGRLVPGEFFPHLLKDFKAIRQYHVIQEERDRVRIRLALEEPMPGKELDLLQKTVANTLGSDVHVDWEIGPEVEIERTPKFRPVLSRVPVDMTTVN